MQIKLTGKLKTRFFASFASIFSFSSFFSFYAKLIKKNFDWCLKWAAPKHWSKYATYKAWRRANLNIFQDIGWALSLKMWTFLAIFWRDSPLYWFLSTTALPWILPVMFCWKFLWARAKFWYGLNFQKRVVSKYRIICMLTLSESGASL